MPIIYSKLYAT